MERKDKIVWIISNILIYLVYLYIAICIPYTADDWDWGLAVGIEQLKTASLNSRYVGNLLVVLMTRSQICKNVVLSVVAWAIPYVFVCIKGGDFKDKMMRLLLCHILVLVMPVDMWAQTYGWVSGFANYVVSMLCIVMYMSMIDELFVGSGLRDMCSNDKGTADDITMGREGVSKPDWKKKHGKALGYILCFVFAVVSQLFLENVSIYFCVISGMALICAVKKKADIKTYIALLSGHLVGLGIMFSSSIYRELFSTGETLTHLEETGRRFVFENGDGILAMIKATVENFLGLRLYSMSYSVTWMMSAILALILIDVYVRKDIKEKVKNGILLGIVGLLLALVLISLYDDYLPDELMGVFYLVFFLVVGAYLIWIWQGNSKMRTLFCWVSSLLVQLPLAVIEEEGTRLYITSYILIVFVMVDLIAALMESIAEAKKKQCFVVVCLAALGLFAYRGYVYTEIHSHSLAMYKDIEHAIESQASELKLETYPHEEYLWREHPSSEEARSYFKEFYGIPASIHIY